MITPSTETHLTKLREAIALPSDIITDISQLEGKVVIFKNGEVFNGGVAVLSYEPDNVLLDLFPDNEFEKVLI